MKRELVERARKGDHDAFAELAGAAITRLDATAWLMLGIRNGRRTPSRTRSSGPGVICPRCAIPIVSTPGCIDCWCMPASTTSGALRRRPRCRYHRDHESICRPSPMPSRRSPIATSSSVASAGSMPEERAVIVLHHYLDLPFPEVAATLRIPLGTAKSRLYRGLRGMRAALDADARPGPHSVRGARMIANDPFERLVSDWLHADAEHRVPDHLDAVLRLTSSGATAAGMVEPRKVAPHGNDLHRAPGACDAARRWSILLPLLVIDGRGVPGRRLRAGLSGAIRPGRQRGLPFSAQSGDISSSTRRSGRQTVVVGGPNGTSRLWCLAGRDEAVVPPQGDSRRETCRVHGREHGWHQRATGHRSHPARPETGRSGTGH